MKSLIIEFLIFFNFNFLQYRSYGGFALVVVRNNPEDTVNEDDIFELF